MSRLRLGFRTLRTLGGMGRFQRQLSTKPLIERRRCDAEGVIVVPKIQPRSVLLRLDFLRMMRRTTAIIFLESGKEEMGAVGSVIDFGGLSSKWGFRPRRGAPGGVRSSKSVKFFFGVVRSGLHDSVVETLGESRAGDWREGDCRGGDCADHKATCWVESSACVVAPASLG